MHHHLPHASQLPYTIGACSESDFEQIKKHIADLELDDRYLQRNQFLSAHSEQGLAGFGRVREHAGCSELCSLGILPGQRLNGLGHALVRQMIRKATQPAYLVCVIPVFFEKLGFVVCSSYPVEIADKLRYCLDSLAVPEPYVVMKL